MKEIDNEPAIMDRDDYDEDELFMRHVIGEDHELLYLDSYLSELFRVDR